jgi:hypothetical protein
MIKNFSQLIDRFIERSKIINQTKIKKEKNRKYYTPICMTCPKKNLINHEGDNVNQLLEIIWKKMLLDLLRINSSDRLSVNEMKNLFKDIFELLGLTNIFSLRKGLTENINTNYLQSKLKIGQHSGIKNIHNNKENGKSSIKKKSRQSKLKKNILKRNVLLDQNLLKMGLEQKTLTHTETRGFSNNSDSFFKEFPQFDDFNESNRKPTMKLNLKVVELSGVGYVNKH